MHLVFSIGFCLALISSSLGQPWCTPECECSIITGVRTLNHAKCTDVNTLLEGKNIPIHSLDISNTNLTKLPHLEKLRNLIILNASNNLLSDIDHLGKRIKTLDLSHNKITSAKLENIPSHIENLDLSYNEITYLPLELTKLSKLKSIEVMGNAINCTCESIQVRNWMQTQVVWTDNHIKCSYPTTVKGMPWLRVKESVVCGRQLGSKHEDEINNDENDLMLGDQPMMDEGSAEKEVNEELGTDYLPVDKKHLSDDDLTEGSGDLSYRSERLQSSQSKNESNHKEEDEEEEGSGGSGDHSILVIETDEIPEDSIEESSSTISPAVFVSLGVFNGDKKMLSTTEEPEQQEVTEELIVPDHISDVDHMPDTHDHEVEKSATENYENIAGEVISPGDNGAQNDKLSEINTAGNNTATHIVIGVIGVLIICLVVFAVIKKLSKRNRSHDIENPRSTEMKDMDRKNLGKPLEKNNGVHEHKPLIGNNDKPLNGKIVPYNDADKNTQEPLLNKQPNNEENPESNNNIQTPVPTVRQSLANSTQPPVSPRTPTSRYGPYPPPKSPKTPSSPSSDDESFQPSSPSQRRYSPVYSPETGKVKIKLSETPKPKTPMLVTRSRSNAGEIVTTPTNPEERVITQTGQN